MFKNAVTEHKKRKIFYTDLYFPSWYAYAGLIQLFRS